MAIKKKPGRPKRNAMNFKKAMKIEESTKSDPFNQKKPNDPIVKKPTDCTVDGCNDPIAPGQTHVCIKHQRSN